MLKIPKLSVIVAERKLKFRGTAGKTKTIKVFLGKPVKAPNTHGDMCCPLKIVGIGDDSVKGAFGVDAVQALIMALWKIQVDLDGFAKRQKGTIEWVGSSGHGFPFFSLETNVLAKLLTEYRKPEENNGQTEH